MFTVPFPGKGTGTESNLSLTDISLSYSSLCCRCLAHLLHASKVNDSGVDPMSMKLSTTYVAGSWSAPWNEVSMTIFLPSSGRVYDFVQLLFQTETHTDVRRNLLKAEISQITHYRRP